MSLCTWAHLWTFFFMVMSSTKNHSIATSWRKNSMIGAIVDISSRALAWVVVLQIIGVDGSTWSTLGWNQNIFSMLQCFQTWWERSTYLVCVFLSCKLVRYETDLFFSIMFELGCTKFGIDQKAIVDPLMTPLDTSLFQIMGLMIFLSWSFSHICGHEVVPS